MSVLGSKLAPETPAYDLQQACDTGIQAAVQVANKIALGQIEVGIAGGTDTTSDAPIAVNEDLREVLLELNRAKSGAARRAVGVVELGDDGSGGIADDHVATALRQLDCDFLQPPFTACR